MSQSVQGLENRGVFSSVLSYGDGAETDPGREGLRGAEIPPLESKALNMSLSCGQCGW